MNERAALDQKPTETDRIGFFGKLPTHGDFVSTGMGSGLQSEFDIWLQAGLQAVQQQFGTDWERHFRAMFSWRFIIERGLWGPATIAGVLVPSLDRVGRSFPLVVATQLPAFTDHPRLLYLDETWFTAAEAIAETSARRDFDIEQFTASLKRLRTLRPADLAENDGRRRSLPTQTTLWWRIDPETRQAKGFRTTGAPQPDDFRRLVFEDTLTPSTPPKSPPAEKPRPAKQAPSLVDEPGSVFLDHAYATHPGTRVRLNADALLISKRPRLFAIADGVGDDNGAVEAGRIAVHTLSEAACHETIEALVQDVKGKLGKAHGLLQSAHLSSGREPPSASIVVLAELDGRFALLWAGDARCYLIRHGMMRCLTRDHVEIGIRRALSRGIGTRGQLILEVLFDHLQPDDRLLLCSASLPRALSERSIAETLISEEIEKTADILVQEALIANCRENLSAIAVVVKTDDT
ncbi:type VI secretion system-associated protein TagF [Rhizobium terrae]|uniref:type VI secretion system-associated protein TagF n=1 Tax=Rhizobium terrae TaxID=2171756 RepID=UPI000E3E8054|nr:type VI secretion system-associated protein TagF [Rhizobium terrae]